MKKPVLLIGLCILFLNLPICFGQSLSNQQKTGLNEIAMMYYQEKSQQEIKSAWEDYIKSNSKINIDDALSYLKQEVKRIGEERMQKAKQNNSKLRNLKLQEVSQDNEHVANMLSEMQKDLHDNAKSIIDNLKS